MYDELYAAWQRELTDASLKRLPPDFYLRIADYMIKIREENRTPDTISVKVGLLEREAQNVQRMLNGLIWARYDKLVKISTESQKVPLELLTPEEAKISANFVTFTVEYQKFANSLLQGQVSEMEKTPKVEPDPVPKRVTLRFTKNIPAIIGADMKTYGPFLPEDIASVPTQNAKNLIKQGLAVPVEVS